jgi:hypothetical protein
MNHHQISDFAPIFCGLVLLSFALSKLPETKPLKPTLGILVGSGLLYGMLKFMLGDQDFCNYVGHRIVVSLDYFRFVFAGIGIGAALTSLFYGHWSTARQVAIQGQESTKVRKKLD